VLFQDVGMLGNGGICQVGANRMLACSGFGVRYQTPIGPFRFDVGWRWHKYHCRERSYAWFLTFGHAF